MTVFRAIAILLAVTTELFGARTSARADDVTQSTQESQLAVTDEKSDADSARANSEGVAFFESKIRPLLITHCQECHTAQNRESEFSVDSLNDLLTGGSRGPAVVPGKPAESLLVSAVKHGELLKMPPKSKLSPRQVAEIIQWIDMGCPWPDSSGATTKAVSPGPAALEPELTPEQTAYWAFQVPVRSHVPDSSVFPGSSQDQVHPVDAFLSAGLKAANLVPAPPAERSELLRRATFDLTGLPPIPKEVDEFLADQSDDAFEKVIERLLSSPRYGEKWGRHWLDVARYADSNGLDENLAYANAWRYRDYVIRSFNQDKPYDVFVREQIAGDLLPDAADESKRQEQLVATGFLSLGAKMLAEDDPVKMQMDIIDEQVDTIGKTFMGLTLGCARCHDHKFDPISTADYYGLAGIFKSSRTMENFRVVARWQELPLASLQELANQKQKQDEVNAIKDRIAKVIESNSSPLLSKARENVAFYLAAAVSLHHRETLTQKAVSIGQTAEKSQMPLPESAVVVEAESFVRGNVSRDTQDYGREIGVLVNNGELPNTVEYEIEAAEAVLHQLEFRYAAAESRPCRLTINDQLVSEQTCGTVTGGWHPEQQQWAVAGFFPLNQGKNLIRLERSGPFPHIDRLLIAPCSDDRINVQLPDMVAALTTEESTSGGSVLKIESSWVRRWLDILRKPETEAIGLLKPWRVLMQELTAAAEQPQVSSEQQFGDVQGQRIERMVTELTERVQLILKAAETSRNPDGTMAALANADDESLRSLLFDTVGPFQFVMEHEKLFGSDVQSSLTTMRSELASAEATVPKFPEAMMVTDLEPEDLQIHVRGSHLTLGPKVARRVPRILAGESGRDFHPKGSGRREFAEWLTTPEHPLTARVMVNRIWQWHFGAAIVRSPDNFGMLGEKPTHPELLDWLATEFIHQGWSIKQMHRLLMTSQAYQMSTTHPDPPLVADPENRLWWHFLRRRLDAEEVRDAILAASGDLDDSMSGTLLPTANRAYVTSTASVDPDVYRSSRRSVYLPVVRSALYDVFQAFDFADPTSQSGLRQATTVAPQALFMMNSELVSKQAMILAENLQQRTADDSERISTLWRLTLGRNPTETEIQRARHYLTAYESGTHESGNESIEVRQKRAWQSLCRAVISTNEFLFVE